MDFAAAGQADLNLSSHESSSDLDVRQHECIHIA